MCINICAAAPSKRVYERGYEQGDEMFLSANQKGKLAGQEIFAGQEDRLWSSAGLEGATVRRMQHDGTRPEDIDTDGEDHAADSVRYACNSRPWARTVKAPPKPARLIQNATLNDLWKAQRPREDRI